MGNENTRCLLGKRNQISTADQKQKNRMVYYGAGMLGNTRHSCFIHSYFLIVK